MEKPATHLTNSGCYVLIAAAGSGQRLGGDLPKQYRVIAGKTVLRHSIECFLAAGFSGKQIGVVIDPVHESLYKEAVRGLDLSPVSYGGNTRNESVYKGLNSFVNIKDEEIVLVHDAARPFLRSLEINNLLMALELCPAATLAIPVADTLRYGEQDQPVLGKTVDRNQLWAVQTPQGFHYGALMGAYENADPSKDYTDETSLVSDCGIDVAIVKGHRQNFKITTQDDLELTARLMTRASTNMETRTGTGFDVHAFADGDKVRLCGIDIPHDRRLSGHSDADVGLHAITDALLGAVAAGDIGSHFPPSDPQWKGAESSVFLDKAVALVKEQGGRITNIDLTLICEAPKIGPHREAMQARVAEICGLMADRVSIKATTTEGLGFTGRKEGIAAQAMATVVLPMTGEKEKVPLDADE